MVVPLSGQAVTGLTVFAFGKLPAHGDFVARGLSAPERDAWDRWASEGLEAARMALGETFEDRHDAAQPWRFAFGPGALGEGWRAGALTPSIDRAGRRFLIILGARAERPLTPDGAGAQVAEILEDQIYRIFGTGGDIDALVANANEALSDVQADAVSEPGRFWSLEPAQRVDASQPPADLIARALTA